MQNYHPKYLGFEDGLKAYRDRSSDSVESTACIALPFSVQTHIYAKSNLGWKEDSTRMVYIDLKAQDDNYGMMHDENSFEMY